MAGDVASQVPDKSNLLDLKKKLEKDDASAEELSKLLNRLTTYSLTKELLQTTRIGVAVGRLRGVQFHDEVRKKAGDLVKKWKNDLKDQDADTANKQPKPKTGKSLSGVSTDDYSGDLTGDESRNKTRRLLWKALCDGMPAANLPHMDVDRTYKLAAEMEDALFVGLVKKSVQNEWKDYWSQVRCIRANLMDNNNKDFNMRIYSGDLRPESIVSMTSLQMASDAKKAEREQQWKECKEACQSDWEFRNIKRSAGQFQCSKCKSHDTSYVQMQTRSADEPMTTFVHCQNCGNRWKF